MKEIIPGYYSILPEMVAELNAKIPAEPKTINLHSGSFDIYFDYDPFSNKSIVTIVLWSIDKNWDWELK